MYGHQVAAEVFGYLLVFARLGTMSMMLPGFGELSVPPRVRLSIALAVALVVYPVVRDLLPAQPDQPAALAVLIGGEIGVGALVGGAGRLIFSALNVTGTVVANATGLSFAQTVDPSQGGQSAVLTTFLNLLAIALVFAGNFHLPMIGAMRDSYGLFTPGHLPPIADFAQLAIAAVSRAFALGIRIASPFLVFAIIFNAGMGLLSRLMPQLQIFFIAAPLQIVAGFGILLLVLGTSMTVFLSAFADSWVPFSR